MAIQMIQSISKLRPNIKFSNVSNMMKYYFLMFYLNDT